VQQLVLFDGVAMVANNGVSNTKRSPSGGLFYFCILAPKKTSVEMMQKWPETVRSR
jgi:hypothetical protein